MTLGVIASPVAIGTWFLFRSFRRWKQAAPRTPEAIQAEMNLLSETRITDRY